jgi:hypothetical protein
VLKQVVGKVKGFVSLLKEGNDPRYLANLAVNKLRSRRHPEGLGLKIMSPKETLNAIVKSKKSFIRWGDADARLILMGNIYYQTATSKVKKELVDMVTSYTPNSPFILCIPSKVNLHDKDMTQKDRETYAICKNVLRKYAKKNQVYGDHLMFYTMSLSHSEIAKLWKNTPNLVIVHFDQSIFKKFSRMNKGKKCFFIKVPEKNTFFEQRRVISEIEEIYRKNGLNSKNAKVLLSAGSGARAIIKKISEKGYIAYDMGTYFGITKYEVAGLKDLNTKAKHTLFPTK